MRTRLMTKQDNKCPNCGEALEESASACPHCGHPASPLGSGHSEGDAFLTLMTANVLRLRRQWAEAETKCGEVLHRHPGNGAAHSLMGDITRDQGKLREAIEWYKMALERNPGSTADRRKLEALIDRVLVRPPEGVMERGLAEVRRALSGAAAEVRSARPPGVLGLVVGTVLLVMLLIALSVVLLGRRAGPPPASARGGEGSGAFVSPPAPAAPQVEMQQAEPVGVVGEVAEELMVREPELLKDLQGHARHMDPNCQVLGAEVAPRDASAVVRISMPRLSSVPSMRESMLRIMSTLAGRAATWDARIPEVRVRCDLREPGRPDQLGAVAEGTRDELEKLAGGATTAQMEKSFRLLWWAPELRE